MNALRQIAAVTAINVRSLPSRLGSSVVVVIGIAGVVGVLVSVMAMAGGLTGTLLQSGAPDRAIVMSAGANFEVASALSRADMQVIVDAARRCHSRRPGDGFGGADGRRGRSPS